MYSRIKALPSSSQYYLLHTFLVSMFFSWPIFVAYIGGRFGIVSVGLYFAIRSVSALFFEIPTGYIADRYGRKASVVIGLLAKIVGIIALVSGPTTLWLIIFAILYGLGAALISGALEALLYQSMSHKEYEQTSALSVPAYQLGLVLSAIVGGFLYEFNTHLPIVAEAIALCISILPVLKMSADTHKAKGEINLSEATTSLKQIFTVRNSLMFLACFLVSVTVRDLFVEVLLEKRMIELSIIPSARGMVIAGIKIIAIVIVQTIVMGRLKSLKTKMLTAYLSGIVGFALIALTNTSTIFILIYLITNPFTMMLDSVTNPIMQKLSRIHTRATDLSMYSLLARLSFAATVPIVSLYLTGRTTVGVFLACVLALLLVFPLLWRTLKWYETS